MIMLRVGRKTLVLAQRVNRTFNANTKASRPLQRAIMRTAQEKVCWTFELFEMIMQRVDMKTLLLAQKVDKRFHAHIQGFRPLQRALWLLPKLEKDEIAPSAGAKRSQAAPSAKPKRGLNPLLFGKRYRLGIKIYGFNLWPVPAPRPGLTAMMDLYFKSLDAACELPEYWSCNKMLVVQPHSEDIAWVLGYDERPKVVNGRSVGPREVLRKFAMKYGGAPSFGELRRDLMVKFDGKSGEPVGKAWKASQQSVTVRGRSPSSAPVLNVAKAGLVDKVDAESKENATMKSGTEGKVDSKPKSGT